jgi:hypothetical protein
MRTIQRLPMLCLLALCGCLVNNWHVESYTDQRFYHHDDAASLRADVDRRLTFLPTIGLTRREPDRKPATEAIFVRDMGDHFHVTVTVRGLADVSDAGWVMTVRVDSYDIGEEGAIVTGQGLLNEIDKWHAGPRPGWPMVAGRWSRRRSGWCPRRSSEDERCIVKTLTIG